MFSHSALPNLLAAFAMLPLLAAGLGLVLTRIRFISHLHTQGVLAFLAGVLNLGASGWLLFHVNTAGALVLHVGARHGPFGIVLVADVFTALILVLTALIFLASVPFAIALLDQRDRMGYYPLSLFLLMGVNGAILAGDLFNLYVFFEILVISSFVLVTLGGQAEQIKGGLRFVVLNLLASMVFLGALAITYGTLGTLNMAHIALLLPQPEVPAWVSPVLAGLLFVAFGSKAALFPLHFWLPCSYHTTHPAINALFGGLLTKVGLYALFRLYPLWFPHLLSQWHILFACLAGLSMIVGTLGALSGQTMRRALSFKIISHVGFIFLGLALVGADPNLIVPCLTAAIVYMVHHMIVKTALLMAGGAVEHEFHSGRIHAGLQRNRGLLDQRAWLGLWFFLAALSLIGIPPFSGFVGKLGLFQMMVATEQWLLLAIAIGASILTLIVVMRLWQSFFWGKPHSAHASAPTGVEATPARRGWLALSPIAGLMACSLLMGIWGQQVWNVSDRAAHQLTDRTGYIQQVALADHVEVEEH